MNGEDSAYPDRMVLIYCSGAPYRLPAALALVANVHYRLVRAFGQGLRPYAFLMDGYEGNKDTIPRDFRPTRYQLFLVRGPEAVGVATLGARGE